MRYAAIRHFDITNGEGAGVSLFVQGCHFHCDQCFNPETWDFSGGKKWTEETREMFMKLINRPYIKRVSFLGGSPLCDENVEEVHDLIKCIKMEYPDKKIWVYTGYTWEAINSSVTTDDLKSTIIRLSRKEALNYIDVLVDGRFVYEKRDMKLRFRGSSNQRIIDVPNSLKTGEVVLWKETV